MQEASARMRERERIVWSLMGWGGVVAPVSVLTARIETTTKPTISSLGGEWSQNLRPENKATSWRYRSERGPLWWCARGQPGFDPSLTCGAARRAQPRLRGRVRRRRPRDEPWRTELVGVPAQQKRRPGPYARAASGRKPLTACKPTAPVVAHAPWLPLERSPAPPSHGAIERGGYVRAAAFATPFEPPG